MKNSINVWDLPIRMFHWSLVLFFSVAYFSAEDHKTLHAYAGYVVFALIAFRIVWGFVGNRYARFGDFVTRPSAVIAYLKRFIARTPPHYTGHNPAGGYMVVALLILLTVVVVTGLEVYGLEGHGPLAATALTLNAATVSIAPDRARHRFWKGVHELASNLALALIILHVLSVLVASRIHKENLVKAMITGKKENDVQG